MFPDNLTEKKIKRQLKKKVDDFYMTSYVRVNAISFNGCTWCTWDFVCIQLKGILSTLGIFLTTFCQVLTENKLGDSKKKIVMCLRECQYKYLRVI